MLTSKRGCQVSWGVWAGETPMDPWVPDLAVSEDFRLDSVYMSEQCIEEVDLVKFAAFARGPGTNHQPPGIPVLKCPSVACLPREAYGTRRAHSTETCVFSRGPTQRIQVPNI